MNIISVVHLVQVEVWGIGRLVISTVEKTDLFERWLQLILYAADDLHKGWTHLGIVLPTHSHQLKPAHTNTQVNSVLL